MNTEQLHVLRIFLASPSDLNDERHIAYEIVDQINRAICPELGWHIELFGWEDALPSAQRPQALINQNVENCHLFIGMLWRRWGQPTGEYSSGFKEEFELAKRLHDTNNHPEIWLFFKKIDPDLLDDPGAHLRQVIEFKSSQIQANDLFYKEFDTTDQWKEMLRFCLDRHLVKQYKQSMQEAFAQQEVAVSNTVSVPLTQHADTEESTAMSTTSAQALSILQTVSTAVEQGELDFVPHTPIDTPELYRFDVIARSITSYHYTNEVLDPHALNRLYKRYDTTHLTPVERHLVFRTMIGQTATNTPGWFWFTDRTQPRLKNILFSLATLDANDNVRNGSLRLLMDAGLYLENIDDKYRLQELIHVNKDKSRQLAIQYVGTVGTLDDIDIIDEEIKQGSDDIAHEASIAKFRILARSDTMDAFGYALNEAQIVKDMAPAILETCQNSIPTEQWLSGLQHSTPWVRKLSIQILSQRSALPPSEAQKLLTDDDIQVRELAYKALINMGHQFAESQIRTALKPEDKQKRPGMFARTILSIEPFFQPIDVDSVILESYRKLSISDLKEKVDWYSVDGPIAYSALALTYFDQFKDNLRHDLETNFTTVIEQSKQRIKTSYGEAGIKTIGDIAKPLEKFSLERFTMAALTGLKQHGSAKDKKFAKTVLRSDFNTDVKQIALQILCKFGNKRDINTIITAITTHDFDSSDKAEPVTDVIRLSKNDPDVIQRLLAINDEAIVCSTIDSIHSDIVADTNEIIWNKLFDSSSDIRKSAVKYFIRNYDATNLQDYLNRYLAEDTWYYNVVCWLVQILYAPDYLTLTFQRQLDTAS